MNLLYNLQDAFGMGDQEAAQFEYGYEEGVTPFQDPYPQNGAGHGHATVAPQTGGQIGVAGWAAQSSELLVMEPRAFDEASHAILALRDRKSVILNLQLMDADQAQRTVDYIAGGAFAMDGSQERLGEHIFLFTPSSVAIRSYPDLTATSEMSASNVSVSNMSVSDMNVGIEPFHPHVAQASNYPSGQDSVAKSSRSQPHAPSAQANHHPAPSPVQPDELRNMN